MHLHSKHGSCRLCGSSLLKCVVPLEPVPLGEHYADTPIPESPRFPIDLYQCLTCNAVQTQDDISPDYLWRDYTYFSGQTQKIIDHFSDFADSILSEYFPGSLPSVLDIGSNDGSLLAQFLLRDCQVQGIDPASTVVNKANSNGIPTELGLFNRSTANDLLGGAKYSLITAFNVFAHSHEMEEMAQAVSTSLEPDGLFCFEVQYLPDIVSKNILGTIFHEHMIHYSYIAASNFMKLNGLTIIDAWRNNIQNGSIIFIACLSSSIQRLSLKKDSVLQTLVALEQSLCLDATSWATAFNLSIRETYQKIIDLTDRVGSVAAFGAARSGPTLAIQFGLDNKITHLFDDHPSKCHKFSPYNDLVVSPSTSLNASANPYCVILAYIHFKPILKSNYDYVLQGGTFILLWPEFILVTTENIDAIVNG